MPPFSAKMKHLTPTRDLFSSPFSPYQRVDLGHIDIVQLLDGLFDLVLVGLDVHDEHQSVVILNLLHR